MGEAYIIFQACLNNYAMHSMHQTLKKMIRTYQKFNHEGDLFV